MIRSYLLRQQMNADRVAALLVTLAPLVYFFPAVRGRIFLSPDDGVIFNVPLRVAAANIIRAGHLPLWNPYLFSGMPLHGAAQAGLLFPLNWFYLLFSPAAATNLMMLGTYMGAALGAYLFARRTGADIAGALATSFIWQFSAFFIEQVGHTNILHTAAMLPWVLWAIEGYVANQARGRGVLLAAIVAVQVFAGHQQTCAYALLLSGAYGVVLIRASKAARSLYISVLALMTLGLLLAAVQILPTIELLRNSLRASASYDFFSSFSMPPRFVWTLFAPYLLGGGNGLLFRAPYVGPTFFGEYVAYVGLLTIMLALVAVFLKRDVRAKFWAVVFCLSLLLAFGRFLPFHLYALVYYIPVLNLFRVPARHLMEVEFALAVLAGRGITILGSARGVAKSFRQKTIVAGAGVAVFLLTSITVLWLRPASFHLGRQAPLTLLRAPELFLPIVIAALSAITLWWFHRSRKRRATVWLLVVLVFDLCLYGQGSGWRTNSPTAESDLWREPATVEFLRTQSGYKEGDCRILTEDQHFDPALPLPSATPSDWMLSLQPDVYMMHGIENAAGYDGFGMARYSRMAGDMKVWGELTDAERTLRGDSRELDLLNVRYLLTRPLLSSDKNVQSAHSQTMPRIADTAPPADFPAASEDVSGIKFAKEDLNIPRIDASVKLVFINPPVEVDDLALTTNLSWSVSVPDNTSVAKIKLFTEGGQTLNLDLRAGEHTAEWAYDRPDIQAQIKHRRPPIASSYKVDDGKNGYQAHSYLASIPLPQREVIKGGEISLAPFAREPDLLLAVLRISLLDRANGKSFPLRREWFTKKPAGPVGSTAALHQTANNQPNLKPGSAATSNRTVIGQGPAAELSTGVLEETPKQRWQKVSQLGNIVVFENTRVLPRAWLATNVMMLNENDMLEVIRSGRLPGGQTWDPAQVALVESQVEFTPGAADGTASVVVERHESNFVQLKSKSAAPSILVLSENHYPGWRAYVDGLPVETVRVDYNLRGVSLNAGEHNVEFQYQPKAVLLGFAVSLLTLLGLLLWWRRMLPFGRT